MKTATPIPDTTTIELRTFDPRWAHVVCGWVEGDAQLRWLAPGTAPPLTPEKVTAWATPEGCAATAWIREASQPIAYGEINPMRHRTGHFWLGHVILQPQFRGRGLGVSFVEALLRRAFERYGARKVALIVFPENIAAIECYLRAGFRAVGEEWHQFLPDRPEEKLVRFEINPQRCATRMGARARG